MMDHDHARERAVAPRADHVGVDLVAPARRVSCDLGGHPEIGISPERVPHAQSLLGVLSHHFARWTEPSSPADPQPTHVAVQAAASAMALGLLATLAPRPYM